MNVKHPKLAATVLILLSLYTALQAEEYLVAHAPQNQQWQSELFFRTQLPNTEIHLEGWLTGDAHPSWTSTTLVKSNANALITPAAFQTLIQDRHYDFLRLISNQPLGEGKVRFADPNMAHSVRIRDLSAYLPAANFNNLTMNANQSAGIAFLVHKPETAGSVTTLRYRLSDSQGNILAEKTERVESVYHKVLALVNQIFPETTASAHARLNVQVDAGSAIVGGILLQVTTPEGKAPSMYGGEAEAVHADISFSKNVSRILQKHCQDCHHDGGLGPFPLMVYEETVEKADAIQYAVQSGTMPPWKPAPGVGNFRHTNELSVKDRETLIAWITDKTPRGEPDWLPEPRVFDGDWLNGQPDMVVAYKEPVPFEPGPDQYVCLPIPLNNPEPIELKGIDILPGNSRIAHHALIFVENHGQSVVLDNETPEPGYLCFGNSGVEASMVGAWAPGARTNFHEEGAGLILPPNATLVVQMHYSAIFHIQETQWDETRLGLYLADAPVTRNVAVFFFGPTEFVIPAGEEAHELTYERQFQFDVDLHQVFPHMHLLGKSIYGEIEKPDGQIIPLIHIPDWAFQWQGLYTFEDPIFIPKGSVLRTRGVFNNSSSNPENPYNPPQDVTFGHGSGDEMFYMGLGVSFR